MSKKTKALHVAFDKNYDALTQIARDRINKIQTKLCDQLDRLTNKLDRDINAIESEWCGNALRAKRRPSKR